MTAKLSLTNTIHVKQQYNIDFLIFKFSLKCSLMERAAREVYFRYTLIMLHLKFLTKEMSSNFFSQWIPLSYLGKAKEILKIFHLSHYKTNPSIPRFPLFLANISHTPISAIFEKSHPLWKEGGEGEGGLDHALSIDFSHTPHG